MAQVRPRGAPAVFSARVWQGTRAPYTRGMAAAWQGGHPFGSVRRHHAAWWVRAAVRGRPHVRRFGDADFGGAAAAEAAARAHLRAWAAPRGLISARWRPRHAAPEAEIEVDLGRGAVLLCDAADLPLVECWSWELHWDPARSSFAARAQVSPFQFLTFAELLRPEWGAVEHLDGNGLNCRRANLREACGGGTAAPPSSEIDRLSWPSPPSSDDNAG